MPLYETEQAAADHGGLDCYATPALVSALADDHLRAVEAVRRVADTIARAVDAAVPRLAMGGRLIYVGAGTSGRLGLLDSVELNPTFSWPRERAIALIAGGERALYASIEGAEDDHAAGARAVDECGVSGGDVLIALAASGTTPFTLAAVDAANTRGALTIGFANNGDTPLVHAATIGIVLDTGAEMIAGSTRLKAGTAQKIALNTLSTALMVRLNKVYGNLMVDVRATNGKLIARATRLTMHIARCDEIVARAALVGCDYRVKTAVVMIVCDLDAFGADDLLKTHNGNLRACLVSAA